MAEQKQFGERERERETERQREKERESERVQGHWQKYTSIVFAI